MGPRNANFAARPGATCSATAHSANLAKGTTETTTQEHAHAASPEPNHTSQTLLLSGSQTSVAVSLDRHTRDFAGLLPRARKSAQTYMLICTPTRAPNHSDPDTPARQGVASRLCIVHRLSHT